MSASISQILETQSALYGAVRAAMTAINAEASAQGLRLAEWPVEKAGCVYTLSITLERSGQEIGECRFSIDWRSDTYFAADDQPLAQCAPQACETLLRDFLARRTAPQTARTAA